MINKELEQQVLKWIKLPYRKLTREQWTAIEEYCKGENGQRRSLKYKEALCIQDNCLLCRDLEVGDKDILPFPILEKGRELLPSKYVNGDYINFMAACYKYLRNDEVLALFPECQDFFDRIGEARDHIKTQVMEIRKKENAKKINSRPVDVMKIALELIYGYEPLPDDNLAVCEDAMSNLITRSISGRSNKLSELEVEMLRRLLKEKAREVVSTPRLYDLIMRSATEAKGVTVQSNASIEEIEELFAHKVLDDNAMQENTRTLETAVYSLQQSLRYVDEVVNEMLDSSNTEYDTLSDIPINREKVLDRAAYQLLELAEKLRFGTTTQRCATVDDRIIGLSERYIKSLSGSDNFTGFEHNLLMSLTLDKQEAFMRSKEDLLWSLLENNLKSIEKEHAKLSSWEQSLPGGGLESYMIKHLSDKQLEYIRKIVQLYVKEERLSELGLNVKYTSYNTAVIEFNK